MIMKSNQIRLMFSVLLFSFMSFAAPVKKASIAELASKGKWDEVRVMLEHKANPDERGENPEKEFFIQEGVLTRNESRRPGPAAIHWACEVANSEAIELLLKHKADANLYDHKGSTPLILLVNRSDETENTLAGVKLLLEHGAKVNLKSKEIPYFTALDYAKCRGHHKTEALLEKAGATQNDSNWLAKACAALPKPTVYRTEDF